MGKLPRFGGSERFVCRPLRCYRTGAVIFYALTGKTAGEGGEGMEKQEMIAKIVAALEESDTELAKLVLLFVSILKK